LRSRRPRRTRRPRDSSSSGLLHHGKYITEFLEFLLKFLNTSLYTTKVCSALVIPVKGATGKQDGRHL
jgi:hypothetical protein